MAWGDLNTWVKKFAPIARLDKQEANFPARVENYLPLVGYQDVTKNKTYEAGAWSWTSVSLGAEDYLIAPSDNTDLQSGNLAEATAYVHVAPVAGQPNAVDLQYWLFYTFNGSETLRVSSWGLSSGEALVTLSHHWADWECVVVRVNSDEQILGVWFSQHSGGQWCFPNDGVLELSGQQPVVYVSMNTHANRPVSGGPFYIGGKTWAGVSFEMVDYARGDGKTVNYANSFVIVANDATACFPQTVAPAAWVAFQGFWGQTITPNLGVSGMASAILAVIQGVPVFLPFLPLIAAFASLPAFVAALGGAFLQILSQDAPKNPSVQGPWANLAPPAPPAPVSLQYAPALAALPSSLALAYVTNDGTNRLVVRTSPDGVHWPVGPAVVPNMASALAPALVNYGSGLCLAFALHDGKNHLQAATTTDLQSWSGPNTVSLQTTSAAPAMAAKPGQICLVFKASDASNRLLSCVSGDDGLSWSGNHSTGQTSSAGPALATFGGNYWLVFVANDSSNRLLYCTSSDGKSWSGNQPVGVASAPIQPALGVFNNQLCLAYVANDGSESVMFAYLDSKQAWTGFSPVGTQTTRAAPAIGTIGGKLCVASFRPGSTNAVVVGYSSYGVDWSGVLLLP